MDSNWGMVSGTDWEVLFGICVIALLGFVAFLTWMACEFLSSSLAQHAWMTLRPWQIYFITGGLIIASFLMGWLTHGFSIGFTVTALAVLCGVIGGVVFSLLVCAYQFVVFVWSRFNLD